MATNQPLQKRRDKLDIMAQIIDLTKIGALKTQIMYKANLSFSQLKQYLTVLQAMGFLEKTVVNDKETYKATEKGTDFLQRHAEVMCLVMPQRGSLKGRKNDG
jgi:predicted transcriptional regulator